MALQENVQILYVGDAQDVVKRIRRQHCEGNVEASALRQHIAKCLGYHFQRTKRTSGSTRIRIAMPEGNTGEQTISEYLRAGVWHYVICSSYEEAHNFQWYAIERLDPALNITQKSWNRSQQIRYESLLNRLRASPGLTYSQLVKIETGPGVYVLHHENNLLGNENEQIQHNN